MSVDRCALVAEARSWIGTPFHHQGSVKGVGCDCIGMVVGVMDALGLPDVEAVKADPRFRGYGRTPNGHDLRSACAQYADEITIVQARAGDVMLFTLLREPMHVGIVSGDDPRYIVHGYSTVGRVVENRLDAKWLRRALSAYRLRGVI